MRVLGHLCLLRCNACTVELLAVLVRFIDPRALVPLCALHLLEAHTHGYILGRRLPVGPLELLAVIPAHGRLRGAVH